MPILQQDATIPLASLADYQRKRRGGSNRKPPEPPKTVPNRVREHRHHVRWTWWKGLAIGLSDRPSCCGAGQEHAARAEE